MHAYIHAMTYIFDMYVYTQCINDKQSSKQNDIHEDILKNIHHGPTLLRSFSVCSDGNHILQQNLCFSRPAIIFEQIMPTHIVNPWHPKHDLQ